MTTEPPTSAGDLQQQYALDRTVLANERTYASWLRTGLAAMVAGLAIEHLLIDVYPSWIVRVIAVTLIFFSALAFLLGTWRYTHLGVRLGRLDIKTIPTRATTAVGLFLALSSLLALLGVLLTGGSP